MTRKLLLALSVCALAALFAPAQAHAWDLFERPNPDVEAGNAALEAGDTAAALEAYGRAARALPTAPGVALNRGLAQLAAGEHEAANEAFLEATQPPAPAALRASAYYDRGVSLLAQAEVHAEAERHREAQDRFRLAAESLRRSLAAAPGNRDAAWNLELALRRLHEEQEEQKKQDEQKEQEEKEQQEQQEQEQQPQDQQPQDQQDQQDQQPQDQQPQDQQDQQPQDQQDQQDQQPQDQQPQGQDQQPQDQQPQQQPSSPDGQAQPQELPADAARILDSLAEHEDSLQRMRALDRAARERRAPTKDW